ncbi:DUF3794 and LysM peptidoglycan-binding domain-containing protein [Anaerotignum sp.]
MPLTLAKETMEMHWKEQLGKQTGQILLEGDMIVPDSKPDLRDILRCEGKVKIREKRISDDRISFSGEMEVCVLYRAKNGEKVLYGMKSSLPLEDFLHMDGLEKDMEVSLEMELEHLDCQIINDRKISVKAIISAEAKAEQKKAAEILTGISGEGVETLSGVLRMENDTAELKDRFTVKEEMTIPASLPEIGEILMEEISLTEQDIRPMDGKAMVRGNLCIHLLYGDGEGNLGSLTEKIPFSGYLENENIQPKTDLTGNLTIEDCRLTPAVDEDGETRQLNADVTIGAVLNGSEMTEQEILLDAYAPNGAVSLNKEEISYPVTVAKGKNQFTIKERITLENGDPSMLRAENVWGEVRLSEVTAMTDAVEAEGVLMADILYHCADDAEPVAMLSRGIPFNQTMELKGVLEGDDADVSLRLEDMDFQMLSEREGELRATVTMEAAVTRQEMADVVKDITMEDMTENLPMAGAVIYMVQKGDSLWKIAKKYRTTVADITAVNEIENPELIYPGQKLLIIKRKR